MTGRPSRAATVTFPDLSAQVVRRQQEVDLGHGQAIISEEAVRSLARPTLVKREPLPPMPKPRQSSRPADPIREPGEIDPSRQGVAGAGRVTRGVPGKRGKTAGAGRADLETQDFPCARRNGRPLRPRRAGNRKVNSVNNGEQVVVEHKLQYLTRDRGNCIFA